MLTREYIIEKYSYGPNSGLLTYKVSSGSRGKLGDVVGSLNNRGYLRTSINGKNYLLHRIIWLYMYGALPENLDHINGIKSDNRLDNLREATSSQNCCNKTVPPNNKLGIKGLTYVKPYKGKSARYRATVRCLGVKYSKIVSITKDRNEEDVIEELSKWLKEVRTNLHKEFTNNM